MHPHDNNIPLSSLSSHPSETVSHLPPPPPAPPPPSSFDSQLHGYSASRDVSDRNVSVPPDLNEIDEPDQDEDDVLTMSDRGRPSLALPPASRSDMPLLEKDDDRERGQSRRPDVPESMSSSSILPPPVVVAARPALLTRTSTSGVRSRSPDAQLRAVAQKKYVLAGVFLIVCLVSFVLQTELGRYVQHELGWNKAYCMLYLTHGSWALLWPAQLLVLRLQRRRLPWSTFWRRHVDLVRSTAHMVAEQRLDVPRHILQHRSPLPYVLRTTALVTTCLTVAGLTWYVAVSMTSPSNLTAIYNCSAFFAYAFSVPLLKERLRLDKSLAVLVAIVGVLVVAYGDGDDNEGGQDAAAAAAASTRFLGNLIIGAGSVLYGLYEVLYKRFACPPEGTSAARGVIFANTFGSCIGLFTLLVLWIPLPVLHVLGWETFELPVGRTAVYLWISVLMNATFAGSFLVLISLTSPVLSSVAALLTIFLVAVADWLFTGATLSAAALTGGALIVLAFLVLSWSTWREMTEDDGAGYREAPVDWDSDASDDAHDQ